LRAEWESATKTGGLLALTAAGVARAIARADRLFLAAEADADTTVDGSKGGGRGGGGGESNARRRLMGRPAARPRPESVCAELVN
jgi:hypothetical protein